MSILLRPITTRKMLPTAGRLKGSLRIVSTWPEGLTLEDDLAISYGTSVSSAFADHLFCNYVSGRNPLPRRFVHLSR